MLILGDWWSVIILGDWWKGSEFLVIGELTNLILVTGESWGVYIPPKQIKYTYVSDIRPPKKIKYQILAKNQISDLKNQIAPVYVFCIVLYCIE